MWWWVFGYISRFLWEGYGCCEATSSVPGRPGSSTRSSGMYIFQILCSHEWHPPKMFCREALLWKHLSHPNALPFLGVDLDLFPSYMCMISPWMPNGTIMKYLEDRGRQSADVDRFVCTLVSSTSGHTMISTRLLKSRKAPNTSIHNMLSTAIFVQ